MRISVPAPPASPAGAACVVFITMLCGCEGPGPEVVRSRGTGATGGAAAATAGQCDRWLGGAAEMLRPGVLDRTAEADKAARLLNLFLAEEACTGVPPGPLPLDHAAAATVDAVLGEGGRDLVTARRLDAADARFLRTRLLDAAAAGALAPGGTDPERTAVALNEYVADTLFPIPPASRPAGTTYHARLRGEGDWADRAWLLADLCRQAGLDAVLLSPAPWGDGAPAGQRTAWVGVLLPGGDGTEIALFDMRTGLPVPSPGDPGRPARLGELATDAGRAALVDFYQTAGIEAPAADAVAAAEPLLIAEPAWFALAHGLISLPPAEIFGVTAGAGGAARAPAVFAPLHDTPAGPGLASRAAAAFGRGPAELKLWPVPGDRAAAAGAAFPATLAAPLRLGIKPARGDVRFTDAGVEYDAEGATPVTGTGDLMWRHRHQQLTAARAGVRAAAAGFAALLPAAGEPPAPGSLLGAPLPPTSDRDRRSYRGRVASGELGDATVAGEIDDAETTYQAARENGIAPWPADAPPPGEYLETNAAAAPDAAFFAARATPPRDAAREAAPRLARLLSGGPNPRKAAAASLLAKLAADAGDVRVAADLARQFVGGPDGPRLKVWLARWAE